jgi:hypothetical protein
VYIGFSLFSLHLLGLVVVEGYCASIHTEISQSRLFLPECAVVSCQCFPYVPH